jgi:PPOX class probable F420-dependent enzyme
MAPLSEDVRTLFEGANIAHVATLLPDGSPHSVAVWAGLTDGRPYFFTQARSRKARNLRADPRLAISVVDRSNPYFTGWVRGRVADTVEGEPALELIDRLSVKYTGEPFPMRSGTVYLIDAERCGALKLPFRDQPE